MSQIIVLDTHIWIWFINQEFARFPSSWRIEIETAEKVGVSPVSCYEVALAHQKGRLELPCSVTLWLQDALEPNSTITRPSSFQCCHSRYQVRSRSATRGWIGGTFLV